MPFIFQPPTQNQEKDTKKKRLKESEPDREVSRCYGNNIKMFAVIENMGLQNLGGSKNIITNEVTVWARSVTS